MVKKCAGLLYLSLTIVTLLLTGVIREAAHQGEKRSLSLMVERFWWPGMAQDLISWVKNCAQV